MAFVSLLPENPMVARWSRLSKACRGLPIDIDQINHELWRRQQGYGRGGRMKIDQDQIEILSGVRHGLSLGSPLALTIENKGLGELE